jgi:hypothetical protein
MVEVEKVIADRPTVGCWMARNKVLFFVLVFSFFALSSCNLHRKTGGGGGGGGGGNATLSFTLIADTPAANPSILSFNVTISGITLTPATGIAQTLQPSPSVIDLMRLQSDTAFLGTLTNVLAGAYTVQVALSNPEITFLNDTGAAITVGTASCASGAVCAATFTASGTPTIPSFTFTVNSMGQQGIGIDFNLKNAISLSGGALSVTFNPSSPNPGVLSAVVLPRTNANLGTNQLDLIEDFSGLVAINGSSVTITSPTRGTLTATSTSSTSFDHDPSMALCPGGTTTLSACVKAGQVASVDAILDAGGTLSIREIEPLLSAQQDFVEGTVVSINQSNQTQFAIVVTDVPSVATTNSLIGALKVGDLLTVNLSTSVNPTFLVDTKGLAVDTSFSASFNLFNGQTNTSAIHLGQTVGVHVIAPFTGANGSTPASATAGAVILRWSRFRATVVSAPSSATININALPSYFFVTPSSILTVQGFFNGSLGTDGVTNLEGISNNAGNATINQPVGFRALYLQNTNNSATTPFFAAKIRQP